MPSKGGSRTAAPHSMGGPVAVAGQRAAAIAASGSGMVAMSERPDMPESPPLVEEFIPDPAVGSPEWADLYARAVSRRREERDRVEREQAEAQYLWEQFLTSQGESVPEGERSLANNDRLHEQMLSLARAAGGRYERENVIGDPNQTFGIEIEFDGADPNEVARALYSAGLTSSPTQQGYHSPRQAGKWVVERDSTVTGEVVSPVLTDTPETWAQLEEVCSILHANGARTTNRTGGHVHVGVDSAGMDHDVNRFRRVAGVCAWAEDLIYRLAAATGRGGRHHRGAGTGYQWCGPMGSSRLEEAQSLSDLANRVGSSHSFGLNYGNILEQRRTIEYRYFDSSLDPARLQANIKLACWITKRASTLPDSAIPNERVRLGAHAGGEATDPGDGLLRRFADLVFVRPQDKLKLYWLFQRSAWQPSRSAV